MQYEFEFDDAKSRANKKKHGIDFVEAQKLFRDERAYRLTAQYDVEPRFLVIGVIAGKHWLAVITYRGDAIRLISVRRARPVEVQQYEAQDNSGGVRQDLR